MFKLLGACLKIALKLPDCTKIILLWQIPNILPKGSCFGVLVLNPHITLRTTAHLIQGNAGKAMFEIWLLVGKTFGIARAT
ncbi:MAG: hypothetical protein K1W39_09790 [Lachnospiraceae bacterium]